MDVFHSPFSITITGMPVHLATPTIEHIINKWTFVHKVSELHWVTLENNVHTDKIKEILELTDHSQSPFALDTKEIDYASRFMGSNYGFCITLYVWFVGTMTTYRWIALSNRSL